MRTVLACLAAVQLLVFSCVSFAQDAAPQTGASNPQTSPNSQAASQPRVLSGASCKHEYYPAIAVTSGRTGTTVFVVTVGIDGNVKNVTITESSGYANLDSAVVECVTSSWHFKPAMLNGQPVESQKKYAVKWQLKS